MTAKTSWQLTEWLLYNNLIHFIWSLLYCTFIILVDSLSTLIGLKSINYNMEKANYYFNHLVCFSVWVFMKNLKSWSRSSVSTNQCCSFVFSAETMIYRPWGSDLQRSENQRRFFWQIFSSTEVFSLQMCCIRGARANTCVMECISFMRVQEGLSNIIETNILLSYADSQK